MTKPPTTILRPVDYDFEGNLPLWDFETSLDLMSRKKPDDLPFAVVVPKATTKEMAFAGHRLASHL